MAAARTATQAAEADCQRVLQAAEEGHACVLEAHRVRLQRLEQDVQLHWREHRVREALEHALNIMKGCESILSQGTAVV